MRNNLITSLLAWVSICILSYAGEAEQTFSFPALEGFVKISSAGPDVRGFAEGVTTSNLEFLEGYVLKSDVEDLAISGEAAFRRYVLIDIDKKLKEEVITQDDFSQLKDVIRTQLDSPSEEFKNKIQSMIDSPEQKERLRASFDINSMIQLGVDVEEKDYIISSMLMKYSLGKADQATSHTVAGANVFIHTRNRLLYLYVYSRCESKADLEWVRQQANVLAREIVKLNEGAVPSGEPTPSGEWVRYSAAGHPKAKGLDFSVEIPKDWEKKDGIRPNVVFSFSKKVSEDSCLEAGFLVRKGSMDIYKEFAQLTKEDLENDEDFSDILPKNAKFIRGGLTKLEGENAVWMEYSLTAERANASFTTHFLQYMVPYRETILFVTIGVANIHYPADSQKLYNRYYPLFHQIVNSVVINKKWVE